MEQILLIGEHSEDTRKVRHTLSRQFPDFEIKHSLPTQGEIRSCLNAHTKMAVLNRQQPLLRPQSSVAPLRNMGFAEPLVILSEVSKGQNLQDYTNDEKTIVLHKPCLGKDLIGVTRKFLHGEKVIQRSHQRFSVSETVGIEAFGIGGKLAGQMLSLSHNGALLKLLAFTQFQLGDIIRVHVRLHNLDRQHLIPARIVSSEHGSEIVSGDHFGIAWLTELASSSRQKKVA